MSAIGAVANTVIKQSVNADASDSGFIVISQRAVVFNLGAAIANTGFNSATGVGAMGLTDAQLAALVQLYQILNALLEAGGWAFPPDGGSSGGVGQVVGGASCDTGDASAAGVNTATSITQKVDATAVGGSTQCVAGSGGRECRPRGGEHGWETSRRASQPDRPVAE